MANCRSPRGVTRPPDPLPTRGVSGFRNRKCRQFHRRYTRRVNFREGWRGHLWQGRFASFVLDEPHLLTAARYVELNPVRAGLINAPTRYRWSSAAAHVRGRDDALVRVAPLAKLVPNWRGFLARVVREEDIKLLRARAYRPATGAEEFLATLEQDLGRILRRQKPGPKAGARPAEPASGDQRVSYRNADTHGANPDNLAPILDRLGLDRSNWVSRRWVGDPLVPRRRV